MDPTDDPATLRLTRVAKRNAPILVFGALALLILVTTAVALAVSRSAPDRGAAQIAAASPSNRAEATATIAPAPSASVATPPADPAPAPTANAPLRTPDPTAGPTDDGLDEGIETGELWLDEEVDPGYDEEPIDIEDPDYMLVPEVNLLIDQMEGDVGFYVSTGETVEAALQFPTRDLDDTACSLTQSYEPDDPEGTPWTVAIEPVPVQSISLADGLHTFVATCPSSVGELTARVRANVMDREPEACRDFEFARDEVSVSSMEELTAGVVGTWKGCVTTPWVPMYEVTVTLRDDGTYSATTTEVLDGTRMIAMYYGTDDDYPSKVYALNDLQDDRLGIGHIDLAFGPERAVRDSLRNVRLMGDKLEFDLLHLEQYGPITFQLYRVP